MATETSPEFAVLSRLRQLGTEAVLYQSYLSAVRERRICGYASDKPLEELESILASVHEKTEELTKVMIHQEQSPRSWKEDFSAPVNW